MRTLWFLLLPGTHILDLGGPLQIMASLEELKLAPINVRCIAASQQVGSFQGVTLSGLHPLPERLAAQDVLFVVGNKLSAIPGETALMTATAQWLAQVVRHTPDVTLCSICTGAFLLGEAGLLDGRECTTHHRYVDLLQARYPKAKVLENRLFVEDHGVFTSAGVSSGTDLALHIVSLQFGKAAANHVGRGDAHQYVGRLLDPCIRYVLDRDVTWAVVHDCFHVELPETEATKVSPTLFR